MSHKAVANRIPGRKVCLGCLVPENRSYNDVRDVDVQVEGSDIPHRTALCKKCRENRKILLDRGPVNKET